MEIVKIIIIMWEREDKQMNKQMNLSWSSFMEIDSKVFYPISFFIFIVTLGWKLLSHPFLVTCINSPSLNARLSYFIP